MPPGERLTTTKYTRRNCVQTQNHEIMTFFIFFEESYHKA